MVRVLGFGCRAVGNELHDLNAEMVGCTGWRIEAVVGSDLGMGGGLEMEGVVGARMVGYGTAGGMHLLDHKLKS